MRVMRRDSSWLVGVVCWVVGGDRRLVHVGARLVCMMGKARIRWRRRELVALRKVRTT